MSKWYVTIDKHSSHIDEPDECVWTVSRDPNCTGWNTDSGYPGYGLTKEDAEELANAANEIERLRAAFREIGEVYAGSEGIPQPITAAEGYLLQLLIEMVGIARAALEGEKKND